MLWPVKQNWSVARVAFWNTQPSVVMFCVVWFVELGIGAYVTLSAEL